MRKLTQIGLLSACLSVSGWALTPGDGVTLDAIASANFVKGEAPAAWNKGEVYILECWATWCGPCIAAIPHVDGLYDKYHEKGLNVLGMNVFENGQDKVVKFVEGKGDGMSYPVAYVGRGGDFDKAWLKPAGINSIPKCLVIKDGKLLFILHPNALNDEMIEGLLAGGEKEKAVISNVYKEQADSEAVKAAHHDFKKSLANKDLEGMRSAYQIISERGRQPSNLNSMRLYINVMSHEWADAKEALSLMKGQPDDLITAHTLINQFDENSEDVPDEFLQGLLTMLSNTSSSHFLNDPGMARLYWLLGEKDRALVAAKKMMEIKSLIPEKQRQDFVDSFSTDEPDTLIQYSSAVSKVMKARAAEHRAKRKAEAAAKKADHK